MAGSRPSRCQSANVGAPLAACVVVNRSSAAVYAASARGSFGEAARRAAAAASCSSRAMSDSTSSPTVAAMSATSWLWWRYPTASAGGFRVTLPDRGARRPAMHSMSVDFPEPFGPRMAILSPAPTENETSVNRSRKPRPTVRFDTVSTEVFSPSDRARSIPRRDALVTVSSLPSRSPFRVYALALVRLKTEAGTPV